MLTVREFAERAFEAKALLVLLDGEEYDLVSSYTGGLNPRLMDMLGEYVIQDFRAKAEDEYSIFLMTKALKASDLK